jgi:vitamin B12 transporter
MKKIFLMAALINSSYLFAQQDSSKILEEVTLTANRFPSKSLQTGKVVILISKENIEKAGSKNLSQLINEQGGIYINGAYSNPGKDKSIYLRGARVEHTLITIDGVPVYDATGIGSNFDIRNLPIETVERIEILKGSQGSLYGSDAVAGVINIITRKPENKTISTEGNFSYGSYHTLKSGIALSGKNKSIDYRIGYDYFNTDGISEAAGSLSAKPEEDGFKQQGIQANIGLQVNDKVRLQPYFRYSTITGELDQDAFREDKDFTYDIKNLQAGLKNEFKIHKGNLKQLYQYTKTKRDYLNDSTDRNILYEKYSFSNFNSDEHFADVYYVQSFGKFTGTIGTDFRASSTEQISFYDYGFGGSPDTLPSPARQNQFSLYAALNYVSSALSIEAGGRYNQHSKYGGNGAFNFNPSYVVSNRVKVFSNISSGYRTPGLYQLYSVYGNKELKPEESLNIEAGFQLLAKENKGSLRATWFKRNVKNLIVFYTSPTFVSNYINRDRQKDHGIEIDGKMDAGIFNIKAFYSYVDGRIETKTGTKDTSYFNLYRRPKHAAALTIGAQITRSLFASLQSNYFSKSKDVYFNQASFTSSIVTLNEYVLVNFYTEYAFPAKRVVLFADLRNIGNAVYRESEGYNTPLFNGYGGLRFKL